MKAPDPKRRRLLVALAVVLAVVCVGTCAELLRRDRNRQERLAMLSVLVQAATSGVDPAMLDEQWPRLQAHLFDELRASPSGEIAQLAYRAAARVQAAVPAIGDAEHPFQLALQYGDEQVAQSVLGEAQAFRWEVEVRASWDRGPWEGIDRQQWSEPGSKTNRLDLHEVMPQADFADGMHVLQLQAHKRLYLPDLGPDAVYFEALELGRYPVRVGTPRPTASR